MLESYKFQSEKPKLGDIELKIQVAKNRMLIFFVVTLFLFCIFLYLDTFDSIKSSPAYVLIPLGLIITLMGWAISGFCLHKLETSLVF